jgi:hypothetical protein
MDRECRGSYKVLLDKCEGNRPLGNPRFKFKDSIKQTPWPLVRKRTIPTDRPPLDEI